MDMNVENQMALQEMANAADASLHVLRKYVHVQRGLETPRVLYENRTLPENGAATLAAKEVVLEELKRDFHNTLDRTLAAVNALKEVL